MNLNSLDRFCAVNLRAAASNRALSKIALLSRSGDVPLPSSFLRFALDLYAGVKARNRSFVGFSLQQFGLVHSGFSSRNGCIRRTVPSSSSEDTKLITVLVDVSCPDSRVGL